jgi:molybdenum cofactor cytidylyltransferase
MLGGRTLLRRTVDAVLASTAWPVVVVLGANEDLIRPEIVRLPVLVTGNPEWAEGLASSIRAGVLVLDSFSLSLEAALLVPCDQPNLSPAAIAHLVGAAANGQKSIVAARYNGHAGPPVLFTRRHFHELLELRGAGGARPLLDRHLDSLALIDLPELATDLDTPEDFASFRLAPETDASPAAIRNPRPI